MEQNVHRPEIYDYRQYDRVWQRVAPNLEPYPGMRQSPESQNSPAEAAPAAAPANHTAAIMAPAAQQPSAAQTKQESQLPGAAQNPRCMGSAAAEMLEVLTGFIEEELGDRRYYLALSRQAPVWARQRLRDIAADANIVTVGDLLCRQQIDVLIHRDGIRIGFTHCLNVAGRIAADKEGGECALFTDVAKQLGVQLGHKLLEVRGGDL